MRFDISSLDSRTRSQQGVKFMLRHPRTNAQLLNEAKEPIFITLAGSNSDTYEAATDAAQLVRADYAARGVTLTREFLRNERANVVAACTMGWNFDDRDGEPFPYSPENAVSLWADKRVNWMLSEAYAFLSNEANFLADTPPG
jgi:hypothetical protein